MVMCIPNLVYNSLDVRYTVFSYSYTFRERDGIGACCNVVLGVGLTVELIVCISLWVNRANCDTITKRGMRYFYSYQIHYVRLANRKSKMAAILQEGHEQINLNIKLDLIGRIHLFMCQN